MVESGAAPRFTHQVVETVRGQRSAAIRAFQRDEYAAGRTIVGPFNIEICADIHEEPFRDRHVTLIDDRGETVLSALARYARL